MYYYVGTAGGEVASLVGVKMPADTPGWEQPPMSRGRLAQGLHGLHALVVRTWYAHAQLHIT